MIRCSIANGIGVIALAVIGFSLYSCELFVAPAHAGRTLQTNAAVITNAPEWLRERQVDKAVDKVQNFLEWGIKRVQVEWYSDEAAYLRQHRLGPMAMAVSFRNKNRIIMGPKVNKENFSALFAHEMVHVVLYQKYKEAIPRWLEEGMANYIAGWDRVDYHYLNAQKLPSVTALEHPFKESNNQNGAAKKRSQEQSKEQVRTHYQYSMAAMEMLAKKCDLHDLLQMSVGKRLDSYLEKICEIKNLDQDLRAWILKEAKNKKVQKKTSRHGSSEVPISYRPSESPGA